MDEVLPAGRLVKIEFEVRLPVAATLDEIEDWINLQLGCGGMAGSTDRSIAGLALSQIGFSWAGRKSRERGSCQRGSREQGGEQLHNIEGLVGGGAKLADSTMPFLPPDLIQ